jgi:hypothetical protein
MSLEARRCSFLAASVLDATACEPARGGSCDFFGIGRRVARPCHEAVGAHEQRAQAEAILGVASYVPDRVSPMAIERSERRLWAEIQQ